MFYFNFSYNCLLFHVRSVRDGFSTTFLGFCSFEQYHVINLLYSFETNNDARGIHLISYLKLYLLLQGVKKLERKQ